MSAFLTTILLLASAATLALSAGSEVTSEARLECVVSRLSDGSFLHQVAPHFTSDRWESSWELKDGTKIAHYPDYNQTLVEGLTNHSITTSQCLGFLLFFRKEWNQEGDEKRWKAVCEVDCSAFMMTPAPRPATGPAPRPATGPAPTTHSNSTDSSSAERLDAQKRKTLAVGLGVGATVVILLLLLGLVLLKRWRNKRKKNNDRYELGELPMDQT